MKQDQISVRLTSDEKQSLRDATEKFEETTGKKPTQSELIIHAVETMANNEPQLYFVDREAIKQIDAMTEFAKVNLQSFTDEFINVTGCAITIAELESCYLHIGKLGSTALTNEAIKEVVKNKLYEKLSAQHQGIVITENNLPQLDLSTLFEIASKMENLPTLKLGHKPVIYWGCFILTSGKITVNDNQVEAIKSAYRHYATSEPELKKLAKVRVLCKALDEIIKDKDVLPEAIFRLVYYDHEAAKYEPTGAWIKYSTTPTILFTH